MLNATKIEDQAKPKKKKSKTKSPNTYVILFFVTAFIAVLSWFIPGGAYDLDEAGQAISGTFHIVEANPQGLWDVLLAPIIGMVGSDTTSAAIAISLTIMAFGSFLEMMDRTGAINAFLKRTTEKNQDNMHALIIVLVCAMAFFGTLEGAYEEGIVYFMMFIPAILSLGLDTVVAIMIVVIGTQVGCLASTVNPFSVGVASGIAGISSGEGLGLRVILLVVLVAFSCFVICRYADMVKEHPERSVQFFHHEKDIEEFTSNSDSAEYGITKKQKIALILFLLVFVIMVLGFIPWTSINSSLTFFDDFVAAIANVPLLAMLLGKDITPFGSWYFNELTMLIFTMTIIIGFVMSYDINEIIDIVMKGASGLVPTAFVVPMARGIQVVMDNGQITPTILHLGETTLSSLPPVVFVIVSLIFYFVIACFIPSSTGLSAATMAIMASLARFANVPVSLMVTIMCMALGMAKMITPTSVVVMTCTSAAHMSYADWVKQILPILGMIFGICCVTLVIGVVLG
jgi:uncharacterized ion transporter superfamily protein YfcC